MPSATPNDDRYSKLKKSVLVGALLFLLIVGWHLYENFYGKRPETEPTGHDIINFTQKLYEEELKHNPYLAHINFQGKTRTSSSDDAAEKPLLELNQQLLNSNGTSTIALMRRLYDNYELDTYAVETITPEERQEEEDFLNAVLSTTIMKKTMQFLEQRGKTTHKYADHFKLLHDIWFTEYSRGQGRIGSSGFEHVFMAELKDQQTILGLHNWVYFSEQEQLGNLDYQGYLERVALTKESQHLMAVRFTFHGHAKRYNTLLIGTSPELELSLYTICFLLTGEEPCSVQLGTTKFSIMTHSWNWKGMKLIASAYPAIEKQSENKLVKRAKKWRRRRTNK